MCCLFTYIGWLLDFIQRVLTFGMSAMICCAVCCLLVTASLAGVALGYNYSLAELIELKETNISVFLKRGVFDDELGDDVNFRRSNQLPLAGDLKDENLMPSPGADASEPQDGRRSLDKSIVESNDRKSYEGALMKISLVPPSEVATTTQLVMDENVDEMIPSGNSIDKLKAIQSIFRRAGNRFTRKGIVTEAAPFPGFSDQINDVPSALRRAMDSPEGVNSRLSPYRLAVPDSIVKEDWTWPKEWAQMNNDARSNSVDSFGRPIMSPPTFPGPITPYLRRPRPTIPKVESNPSPPARQTTLSLSPAPAAPSRTEAPELSADEGLDQFQGKFKLNIPTLSNRELEMRTMFPLKMEDYEDEPVIPSRKRRFRRRTATVAESLSTASPGASGKNSIAAASLTTSSYGISGNNLVAASDTNTPTGVSRKSSVAASVTTPSTGVSRNDSAAVYDTITPTGVFRKSSVSVSVTTPLTGGSRNNSVAVSDIITPSGVSRKSPVPVFVTTSLTGVSRNDLVAVSDTTPETGVSRKNTVAFSVITPSFGLSGKNSVNVSVITPSTSRKNYTGHIDPGDAKNSMKSLPLVSVKITAR